MKSHHCHCDLKSQLGKFRAKKLGVIGVVIMVLHILFHVAECLVLPALLVAFSGNQDDATAVSEDVVEMIELDEADMQDSQFSLVVYSGSGFSYCLDNYYSSGIFR